MVEKMNDEVMRWLVRHSREVQVRLALGHSITAIAETFGCGRDTVTRHIELEAFSVPSSSAEILSLAVEVEGHKVIEDVFGAMPGSAAQARLRTSLLAFSKPSRTLSNDEETGMKSLKDLEEMADDELRDYVASLVPGLEVKDARAPDETTSGSDGKISVPDDGTPGTETTKAGDKLA